MEKTADIANKGFRGNIKTLIKNSNILEKRKIPNIPDENYLLQVLQVLHLANDLKVDLSSDTFLDLIIKCNDFINSFVAYIEGPEDSLVVINDYYDIYDNETFPQINLLKICQAFDVKTLAYIFDLLDRKNIIFEHYGYGLCLEDHLIEKLEENDFLEPEEIDNYKLVLNKVKQAQKAKKRRPKKGVELLFCQKLEKFHIPEEFFIDYSYTEQFSLKDRFTTAMYDGTSLYEGYYRVSTEIYSYSLVIQNCSNVENGNKYDFVVYNSQCSKETLVKVGKKLIKDWIELCSISHNLNTLS